VLIRGISKNIILYALVNAHNYIKKEKKIIFQLLISLDLLKNSEFFQKKM